MPAQRQSQGRATHGFRKENPADVLQRRLLSADSDFMQHDERDHTNAVVGQRFAGDGDFQFFWHARALENADDRNGIGGRNQRPKQKTPDAGQFQPQPGWCKTRMSTARRRCWSREDELISEAVLSPE